VKKQQLIALDIISQSEHSRDTFCFLITDSEKLANSVNQNIMNLIKKIKRSDLVKPSLKQNGFIAICKNKSDMIALANELAPEHLQIMTQRPQSFASKITSAGLILLGNETPSSASDYILGSNHILPRASLAKISKYLDVFTKAEGLPNHYEAVRGRLK
jgi:histidinol dehydrogenase